jgi:arsenite-transporting ATPase
MKLPFVEKEDVDMFKHGDELIVRVGAFKRHISLPQRMSNLQPETARVEDGDVIITFSNTAPEVASAPVARPLAVQTRK